MSPILDYTLTHYLIGAVAAGVTVTLLFTGINAVFKRIIK